MRTALALLLILSAGRLALAETFETDKGMIEAS